MFEKDGLNYMEKEEKGKREDRITGSQALSMARSSRESELFSPLKCVKRKTQIMHSYEERDPKEL